VVHACREGDDRPVSVIKNRAAFAEFAAPEAVAAHLKVAKDRAARANREVRWLEKLLAEKISGLPLATAPNEQCGDSSCPCMGGAADTGAAHHVHVCPPDAWCGCE
jgi:hypothetical protein